jgi:hypothetical protein
MLSFIHDWKVGLSIAYGSCAYTWRAVKILENKEKNLTDGKL